MEIVSLRLTAIGALAKPVSHQTRRMTRQQNPASRPVYGRGSSVATPVWSREAVSQSKPLSGPAIIEETYTSIYIPAGWQVITHPTGALVADRTSTN